MRRTSRPPHPGPLPPGGEGSDLGHGYLVIVPRRGSYRGPGPPPERKPRRRRSSVGRRRRATVHTQPRQLVEGKFDYPKLCLYGLWLEDAGFLIGQRYEIEVGEGRLVLQTV